MGWQVVARKPGVMIIIPVKKDYNQNITFMRDLLQIKLGELITQGCVFESSRDFAITCRKLVIDDED